MKILLSAYACEPGEGSEPGIGWNWAKELSRNGHQVWALTRENNRKKIENELKKEPLPLVKFVYFDFPPLIIKLKRGKLGILWYYYLWQVAVYFVGRRLNSNIRFDCAHHVTFVKYWSPVFLSLLPIPFIWGPVGGGESAPIFRGLGIVGFFYEIFRIISRKICEFDPFVRITAKRSVLAFGTTRETSKRLIRIGAKNISVVSQVGIRENEIIQMNQENMLDINRPVKFVYAGTLDHFKGIHLALRAFSLCRSEEWFFSIIGTGREKKKLIKLTESLNIQSKIRFYGKRTHLDTIHLLKEHHVLVFPALHDSGGLVCIESMSLGLPVICFNTGGPGLIVSRQSGVLIQSDNVNQMINDLALSFEDFIRFPEKTKSIGKRGIERVADSFLWSKKYEIIYSKISSFLCDRNENGFI